VLTYNWTKNGGQVRLRIDYAGITSVRRCFFEKIVRVQRLAKFGSGALICQAKRRPAGALAEGMRVLISGPEIGTSDTPLIPRKIDLPLEN
jgi:hypothetical protein